MISTFKKIGLVIILTMIGMFTAQAQNNAKVIAVLNKADWCPICKANGPRVEKDLMPMMMQNKDLQFVVNDLSNDKTKAVSNAMLAKAGIASFSKMNNGTGMIYFLNAKSKMLISSASLADSNEEIVKAYKTALNPAHGEKGHVCDASCKAKM
ncbi:hypothetical protein [Halpernia sp. GG3]